MEVRIIQKSLSILMPRRPLEYFFCKSLDPANSLVKSSGILSSCIFWIDGAFWTCLLDSSISYIDGLDTIPSIRKYREDEFSDGFFSNVVKVYSKENSQLISYNFVKKLFSNYKPSGTIQTASCSLGANSILSLIKNLSTKGFGDSQEILIPVEAFLKAFS